MRIKCAVCGRIYKAKIPTGGDGSVLLPRMHYQNKRLQDDSYCLGSFTEGELIEGKKMTEKVKYSAKVILWCIIGTILTFIIGILLDIIKLESVK